MDRLAGEDYYCGAAVLRGGYAVPQIEVPQGQGPTSASRLLCTTQYAQRECTDRDLVSGCFGIWEDRM